MFSRQLRVLRLGLLQDGDVGIGVFREGEEVLICCATLRRVAGERVGTGKCPSLNQPLTEKSSIDDIFLSLIRLTYDGEFSTDSTAVDNK